MKNYYFFKGLIINNSIRLKFKKVKINDESKHNTYKKPKFI